MFTSIGVAQSDVEAMRACFFPVIERSRRQVSPATDMFQMPLRARPSLGWLPIEAVVKGGVCPTTGVFIMLASFCGFCGIALAISIFFTGIFDIEAVVNRSFFLTRFLVYLVDGLALRDIFVVFFSACFFAVLAQPDRVNTMARGAIIAMEREPSFRFFTRKFLCVIKECKRKTFCKNGVSEQAGRWPSMTRLLLIGR